MWLFIEDMGYFQATLDQAETEKTIVLAFVQGQNVESMQISQMLDDDDFMRQLNSHLVILRYDEEAYSSEMFGKFYEFDSTPTVYLIASDSSILDKITGYIDRNDLIARINQALNVQNAMRLNNQQRQSGPDNVDNIDDLFKSLSIRRGYVYT